MSDILLDALTGKIKADTEYDPYALAGAGLAAAGQRFSTPQNPWLQFGTQLGTSLLGSALAGYGSGRQENKAAEITSALAQALAASDPGIQKQILDEKNLSDLLPSIEMQRQLDARDLAIKGAEESQSNFFQGLNRGLVIDPKTMQVLGQVPGYAGTMGDIAKEEAYRRQQGTEEAKNLFGTVEPAVQPILAKAYQNQELTPEEATIAAAAPLRVQNQLQKLYSQNQLNERAGNTLGLQKEKLGITKSEREYPLYQKYSEEVPTPTATEAKDVRARVGAMTAITQELDSIAKNPTFTLTGEEAISNKALSGLLFNQLRNFTGSGANLTGPEIEKMRALIIPTVAGGDSIGTVFAKLTGREKEIAASAIKKVLWASLDAELAGRGFKPRGRELSKDLQQMLKISYGQVAPVSSSGSSSSGARMFNIGGKNVVVRVK